MLKRKVRGSVRLMPGRDIVAAQRRGGRPWDFTASLGLCYESNLRLETLMASLRNMRGTVERGRQMALPAVLLGRTLRSAAKRLSPRPSSRLLWGRWKPLYPCASG